MRKKSILKSLIVLLSFLFLVFPTLALASEGDSEKSASVQTNGEISFYTDATSEPPTSESSTAPTVDSSTAPTTAPTTTPSSTLPSTGGKLPTTGEVVKQGLMYGGVALLVLSLFYIWKRRKNDENKGGMNR